jgi:hypothetical protein
MAEMDMLELEQGVGIDAVLHRLIDDSVARWGVPERLARSASSAARRSIPWDTGDLRAAEARVEAYYWGALRGMALRSRDAEVAPLKARFALATIVQDMVARGMASDAVRDAVLAAHGDLLVASGISESQLDIAC